MSSQVPVENLANEIMSALTNYSQDIADGMKSAVDRVAKEAMQEIKDHVAFNEPTGAYVKAFRIKTTEDTRLNRTKVWHVTDHQYGLTHLLENGHALRGGGRSRAYPHIIYGDTLAKQRLTELAKEVVENANKP